VAFLIPTTAGRDVVILIIFHMQRHVRRLVDLPTQTNVALVQPSDVRLARGTALAD